MANVRARTLLCPVCRHPSHLEQRCKDADLYRCNECDHCFSDPESIRAFETYGTDYFEKHWFENENVSLFKSISDLIVNLKPNASVVDVGCGNGAFLRHLRRNCSQLCLVGIDLSKNTPQDGIEFLQGDFLHTSIARQFDFVVSLAVIEHVLDVRAFMARMHALCAPGGSVIVMTMNDQSLLYRTARFLKRLGLGMAADQLYSSHHVNHFNVRSLRRLATSVGFEPEATLLHNIPMAAVDVSSRSRIVSTICTAGVWGIFTISRFTRSTYLQTVICRRKADAASPQERIAVRGGVF